MDGHLDEAVRKTIIRVVDQTFTHPPAHHGEVGNALGVRRKNHLWRMRSQKGFQLPNETRRYLAARPLRVRVPESHEGEPPFIPGPHPVGTKNLHKRVSRRERTREHRSEFDANKRELSPSQSGTRKWEATSCSEQRDDPEKQESTEREPNAAPRESEITGAKRAEEEVGGGSTHRGPSMDPTHPQDQAVPQSSEDGQEAMPQIQRWEQESSSHEQNIELTKRPRRPSKGHDRRNPWPRLTIARRTPRTAGYRHRPTCPPQGTAATRPAAATLTTVPRLNSRT